MQFLVEHSEKFVIAVFGIFALWFAIHGFGYQTLSWQPNELEQMATEARQAIEASPQKTENEDLKIFDYAGHAEQIKKPIPAAPYRIPPGTEWEPVLGAQTPQQRAGVTQDSEEPLSEPEESPLSEPSQDEPQ